MSLRITILNSDAGQLAQLSGALSGYRCQTFHSPNECQRHLDQTDLFLLDLQSLQGHGPNREHTPAALLTSAHAAKIPILLSAARSESAALENALAAGVDDYVLKPLRLNEVLLRVQILLKRAYPQHAQHQNQQQIRFADYVFETPSHRITRAGATIDVTQKEFELALLLFGNLGRPLSRAYIQDAIWSRDSELPSRTMDTHISRVRNKLQLKPEHGFRLTPVYGYGYQLEKVAF